MLVPPAFVWNSQKAVQYLFTQPFSHYRDPAAYPPHHIHATASYFTTLKSTVDLDGRFLVFHSSHRAECFLYLYTATAVCRSTCCSGLAPALVTRLSGPSHYPALLVWVWFAINPKPRFWRCPNPKPGFRKNLWVWNPYSRHDTPREPFRWLCVPCMYHIYSRWVLGYMDRCISAR